MHEYLYFIIHGQLVLISWVFIYLERVRVPALIPIVCAIYALYIGASKWCIGPTKIKMKDDIMFSFCCLTEEQRIKLFNDIQMTKTLSIPFRSNTPDQRHMG